MALNTWNIFLKGGRFLYHFEIANNAVKLWLCFSFFCCTGKLIAFLSALLWSQLTKWAVPNFWLNTLWYIVLKFGKRIIFWSLIRGNQYNFINQIRNLFWFSWEEFSSVIFLLQIGVSYHWLPLKKDLPSQSLAGSQNL